MAIDQPAIHQPVINQGRLHQARAWLRTRLFASKASGALSLLILLGVGLVAYQAVMWGVVHAVWSVPHDAAGHPQTDVCRAAQGQGACWAIIPEKFRFILFGVYPYDQQWRPALCIALFLSLYVISSRRRFWRKELALVWGVVLVAIGVLMWGGVFGLPLVPEDAWGGLPVTLILATFGLAVAFPLAVLTALGRRATGLPAVRMLCVVYVELIRGVPLISLLFMASVMFMLFMPPGWDVDKLLRAQVAIILFAAAYLSEVVRAGLQAVPKGQYEAANALGLSWWSKTRFIILPQALKLVIPPLVNTFIGFFKDTSLVMIVGIYDLTMTGKVAMRETAWQGFGNEIYLLLAVIYFAFCFSMSRTSQKLEQDLNRAQQR